MSSRQLSPTRNYTSEDLNCNEISNYKFDSREFNPFSNLDSFQLTYNATISIRKQGQNFSFLMPTTLFNTSRSIIIDSGGYKTNPKLYHSKEYRALFFLGNGKFSGIEAVSEESADAAFQEAYQKCLKENYLQ